MTKQCLANPYEFGDIEVCLTEKRLNAADVLWTLWIAMLNGDKVYWLTCNYYNGAVVDREGAESIH